MTFRRRLLSVVVAVAAVAAVASIAVLPATAGAARKAKAKAAVTQNCRIFHIVLNDPQSGFVAGYYHRLNFSPKKRQLTCLDTYHILRSYLYDPGSMRGWKVGSLKGELKGQLGHRFTKNGGGGKIGFDVFRPAPKTKTK